MPRFEVISVPDGASGRLQYTVRDTVRNNGTTIVVMKQSFAVSDPEYQADRDFSSTYTISHEFRLALDRLNDFAAYRELVDKYIGETTTLRRD